MGCSGSHEAASEGAAPAGKPVVSSKKGKAGGAPRPSPRPGATIPEVFSTDLFSDVEQLVLTEVNKLRTDPRSFAKALGAHRKNITKSGSQTVLCDTIFRMGTPIPLQEGNNAFDELVNTLSSAFPVKCVQKEVFPGLVQAARDDVAALRCDESCSEENSTPRRRISAYGKADRIERISFTGDRNAFSIVSQLAMCDGKPGRQARKILLDPDMREYGIAHGANSAGVPVTVLYVASGYQADEAASVELKPARVW